MSEVDGISEQHLQQQHQHQHQQAEEHGQQLGQSPPSSTIRGGIAQIDMGKLERHIASEVEIYGQGVFPRQSERYYRLMSVLHITRLLYHDGHCQPIHRDFYRQLAQVHQQQQQEQQQQEQEQEQELLLQQQ